MLAWRYPVLDCSAVKVGAGEPAVGSAVAWSGQFAPLAVYATPWLAPEPHQLQALAADGALRQRLFALMESQGVVGLAIAPLGEHVLATAKAPVESPADCRGLRVRVMPLRPVLDVYLA